MLFVGVFYFVLNIMSDWYYKYNWEFPKLLHTIGCWNIYSCYADVLDPNKFKIFMVEDSIKNTILLKIKGKIERVRKR